MYRILFNSITMGDIEQPALKELPVTFSDFSMPLFPDFTAHIFYQDFLSHIPAWFLNRERLVYQRNTEFIVH